MRYATMRRSGVMLDVCLLFDARYRLRVFRGRCFRYDAMPLVLQRRRRCFADYVTR